MTNDKTARVLRSAARWLQRRARKKSGTDTKAAYRGAIVLIESALCKAEGEMTWAASIDTRAANLLDQVQVGRRLAIRSTHSLRESDAIRLLRLREGDSARDRHHRQDASRLPDDLRAVVTFAYITGWRKNEVFDPRHWLLSRRTTCAVSDMLRSLLRAPAEFHRGHRLTRRQFAYTLLCKVIDRTINASAVVPQATHAGRAGTVDRSHADTRPAVAERNESRRTGAR